MKKFLTLLAVFVFVVTGAIFIAGTGIGTMSRADVSLGSDVVTIDVGGESGVTLLDQDRTGMTVRMDVGSIHFIPVTTPEGDYILPYIDNFSRSFEEGDPTLPVASRLISIPFDCSLETEVLDTTIQKFDLGAHGLTAPFMPVQPPLSKSQVPEMVPFVRNIDSYKGNQYALPLVSTEIKGTLRAIHMGRLMFSPVEYFANANRIKVYTSVTVRITYNDANWAKTDDMKKRYATPYFNAVNRQILNYEEDNSEADLVKYPIKYAIVADPMFESQLQAFIDWKTRKGFNVVVGYTDVIGTSQSAIKGWIEDLYDAGTTQDPAPSFVLFVGDDQQIQAYSGSAGSHITDLRYCEFTGDDMPEIYYGRFSAQNTSLLQPQIDKTLEYEQYTMPDPSYLNEVTLVSGVDSGYADPYGNGQINYGTNLYFNAAHGISPNVWLYPASDGSSAPADIRQTISDGVGFYNYTAHCSHTGPQDPSFSTSDIDNLTNNHKWLLGIGNCCLSNTFGDDYSTPCFGEKWLQTADKGGIGWIGGSNSTYWDEDYWFGVGSGPIDGDGPTYAETGIGAYDGIFHDHGEAESLYYRTNGAIIFCGNMAVTEAGSSRTQYYWEIYHLMGDPSVMTYMDVPTNNTVSHPSGIDSDAVSVTVQADPGSYVGISRDNVLHGAGYIGSSGSAVISLTAFGSSGDADIVVTCQFRVPYISTISVSSGTNPPTAGFSGSPTTGMAPLTVNFTDGSTGATSWSWDFGDTGTSTQQNPVHTYTTAGTYTVSLTATNAYGSDTETKTNYITVTAPQPPVAEFSASSTTVYVGNTVNFTDESTNTPTSWSWTFEGGTPATSTSQNPSVQYNSVGTFNVTLTATNAAGNDTETKTDYITVSDAPLNYCASQGNNFSYEYIGNVTVADLDNTSTGSNYTDYTNLTANLTAGTSVNVSLTPVFPSTTYTEFWKIWIDYNLDGDFEDAGEEVFSDSGTTAVSGSFTVASVEVTTRMRVSMKWDAAPTPCESFSYGEVEDYTVVITGAGPQYTLTTNTVGNGSISLNPSGGTYTEGTVVTVTAAADSGWQFDNWSGALSGSTNPTTITMDGNKSITANFSEVTVPQYTLTVSTVGNGSVGLNPTGGTYNEGTVVTVTATADSGWQFDNWSGALSGSTNPTTITMNANRSVTANFSEVTTTETVGNTTVFGTSTTTANRRAMPFTMPANGTISSVTMYHTGGSGNMILGVYDGSSSAPGDRLGVTASTAVGGSTGWQTINLTSPAYVAGGSTVWLAWVYESNPGIYYESGSPGRADAGEGWSGGMPDPFGGSTQANYLYSIYADYTPSSPPQYTVTVNVVGNGSVALNPPGGTYDAGTELTLTATADSGWQFDNWSGDLTGSTNPATITVNSDMTITVNFSEVGATGTVGITDVYSSSSTSAYRRAMPFTMPENGTLTSVSMYHTGGSGNMILAVYDGTSSAPGARLAVTASTAISGSTGWQTINLTSPVAVSSGQTVWLAWVYESNPGIRYQTGSPGRYQSTQTWSGGMPDPFGSGSQGNYLYSIYATYNK